MPSLHISKVAVGCGSVEALRKRQSSRLQDGVVPIITRFRPKRADELIGGSIYWIVKHRIAVRQTILGFDESESRPTHDHPPRSRTGAGAGAAAAGASGLAISGGRGCRRRTSTPPAMVWPSFRPGWPSGWRC